MNHKEAIEILAKLQKKRGMDAKEKEAILTAIGVLGWTSLVRNRQKNMKKSGK